MPCTNCSAQFGVFKRKKQCHECRSYFCSICLKRDRVLCNKCTVLTARPLSRSQLLQLKTRDLIIYLKSIHVSTSGCVEKEDLVNLLITHVNNSSQSGGGSVHNRGNGNSHSQSRPTDDSGNIFRQFNLQNIWATVQERYDNVRMRPFGESRPDIQQQQNAPANPNLRTYTRTRPPYFHEPTARPQPQQQNVTINPNDMPSGTSSSAAPSPRVPETSDCVEIEDIGDWEFVSRTGETLSDSDPAIIADAVQSNENGAPLRRTTSESNISTQNNADIPPSQSVNRSMQDLTLTNEEQVNNIEEEGVPFVNIQQSEESLNMEHDGQSSAGVREKEKLKPSTAIRERVRLSDIREKEDLEDLSVKQLKELLIVNRVDFKGCCEKNELLERVSRLWNEHSVSRENLEQLPFDDLCKICMDAPVECVMLECGHIATCTACGKQLSECPICRQYVVRVVRIFKA